MTDDQIVPARHWTDRLDDTDVGDELAEEYGGEGSDWDDIAQLIVQRAQQIAARPADYDDRIRARALALRAEAEAHQQ